MKNIKNIFKSSLLAVVFFLANLSAATEMPPAPDPEFKISTLAKNPNIEVALLSISLHEPADISPNGRYAVVYHERINKSSKWKIKLYDLCVKKKIYEFNSNALKLVFSPNDRFLAFLGKTWIWIWDIASCSWVDQFDTQMAFEVVKFAPDNRQLFIACEQVVVVRDFVVKDFVSQIYCGYLIDDIEISLDGKYFIAEEDKLFKLWDMSGNCIRDIGFSVHDVNFDLSGKFLVTPASGDFVLWDVFGCPRTIDRGLGMNYNFESVALSPLGRYIITKRDCEYKLYNTQTGKVDVFSDCGAAAFFGDDLLVFAKIKCNEDFMWSHKFVLCKLELWDLNAGECIHEFDRAGLYSIKSINFCQYNAQIILRILGGIEIYTDLIAQRALQEGVTGVMPWRTVFGR